MSWEEFLTKVVMTFREGIKELGPSIQKSIRENLLDESLLEPCQIEVFDLKRTNSAIWLVVHDSDLPDMEFRIEKRDQSLDASEFSKASKFLNRFRFYGDRTKWLESALRASDYHIIFMKHTAWYATRDSTPESLGNFLLSVSNRTKQYNTIQSSTTEIKESIAKIPKEDIREELMANAKKIDSALSDIRRMDEEIGGVRKLIGTTKEFQDFRAFAADVEALKESHIYREVFDSEIKRIDEKINKGLESLNTRIEDIKAIKFWSKRTLLEITLAIWGTIVTLYAAGILKL